MPIRSSAPFRRETRLSTGGRSGRQTATLWLPTMTGCTRTASMDQMLIAPWSAGPRAGATAMTSWVSARRRKRAEERWFQALQRLKALESPDGPQTQNCSSSCRVHCHGSRTRGTKPWRQEQSDLSARMVRHRDHRLPNTGNRVCIGQDGCLAGRWRGMGVRMSDGTTMWIIRNAFNAFDTDDLTDEDAVRFGAMASEQLDGYRYPDVSGRRDGDDCRRWRAVQAIRSAAEHCC